MTVELLHLLRDIDNYFTKKTGEKCRVSVSIGSAVGNAPGEEWLEEYATEEPWCVLTFIQGNKAYSFRITDDEWDKGPVLIDNIIEVLRAEF